jgi:hypothetical protein
MLRHSLGKSQLSLTSKEKTQVTAYYNSPDVIQLFAQQRVTCETFVYRPALYVSGSDVRITEVV